MRDIFIILIATCLLSCTLKTESNNNIEGLLQKYCTDSLDIQKLIGSENYMLSYKIKKGKLLIQGGRNKERTSDNYTSLIFVIDIENKKLLTTIEDPVKDYIGLKFDLVDDNTLFLTHILTRNEIYLINIHTHETEKKHLQFDKSANRPGKIDINGNQVFMTKNVYGFAVADLRILEGKVFVNSHFSTSRSTVSYPIDTELNLLSGTLQYDSLYNEIITLYAIDNFGKTKWEKALPPVKYDLDYSGAFSLFNFQKGFIVRYHNNVECWDKTDGKLVWSFANEYPITKSYMVGNKLIVYSFFDSTRMIPSQDEERNQKIIDGYKEQFKIIDLETGQVKWSKNINGTSSGIGILNDKLVIINKKEKIMVNIDNGEEQETPLDLDIDSYNQFDHSIDTKTGKLYLDYKGALYW